MAMRRKSGGHGSIPQVDALGRRLKKVQYENTYRMDPKVLFPVEKATGLIRHVMETHLTNEQYDPDKCMSLCKTIAQDIRELMKDLAIERFKYVTVVHVGPSANTTLMIASRGLLDPEVDTYATYTFAERGLFAVATVYAFYRE